MTEQERQGLTRAVPCVGASLWHLATSSCLVYPSRQPRERSVVILDAEMKEARQWNLPTATQRVH